MHVEASTTRVVAFLPNLLSVFRLALAAAFPLAMPSWRLAMVVAAGLSDWLDGFIARRFAAGSTSGRFLDAAADKLFVFSALVTLTLDGGLVWWQTALVLARDVAVTGVMAYILLRGDRAAFRRVVPRFPGKATTAGQFALLVALLLFFEASPATIVILILAASCSVLAAADYLNLFIRALREDA